MTGCQKAVDTRMTLEQLKVVSRLIKTQDGKDFLNEVLRKMVVDNYNDILTGGRQSRDELVGFGVCLKEMVVLFENCDIRLAEQGSTEPGDWA